MSVSCSVCDKVFANKYSLASHTTRYHTKKRKEDALATTESDDDHQETGSSTTETEEESNNESKSNTNVNNSTEDKSEDDDTDNKDSSGDDNQTSVNGSEATFDRKMKSTQRKEYFRKRMRNNYWTKNKVFDLLSSIEVMLDKHTSKSSTPFDLLGSYRLKSELFGNLRDFFGSQVLLEKALTDEERLLVDAVLVTTSLDEVTRLLNTNAKLIPGIIDKTKTKEEEH